MEIIKMFVPALSGVVVGFLLCLISAWSTRRRKLKAHWAALKAEAEKCRQDAQGFLNKAVQAPLCRLPEMYFLTCLPVLLAEGDVKLDESAVLMDFFSQVQAFNRGMDLVTEMFVKTEGREPLGDVHGRNVAYAEQVIERCSKAIRVIESHLASCWRRRWGRKKPS